ncbi:hypothetical protein [Paracoccus sp. IB05]|uniref:hypothetical protein n=1 Tax=Paracoccus sp. IB05 TaxID=2779367 RepID=UPI0018E85A82|nr:hypothetical protein [Paracoccus sp. IB05]MBJ2153880.1 hypothetical protein [Paracoccus sp. IB05]
MTRSPDSPRISANDLALYMVSSDTARLGIIKRAAEPQTFVVTRYKDVRPTVKAFLTDLARSNRPLVQAEAMFAQRAEDPAETPIRQDDARQSIEVLRALQAMSNQLSSFSFHDTPQSQPKLTIAGVEVSVRADLWVHGASRGVEQIGGALLRMTQDDAETPSAATKRRDMGLYAATLMRLHLDGNNPSDRTPANRLCMSIDIRHGQVFAAPTSNARRMSDIEAACRGIAALWGTV